MTTKLQNKTRGESAVKKRMWKRILALVLVLTMLAGDPTLAYAAEGNTDSSVTMEVHGEAFPGVYRDQGGI